MWYDPDGEEEDESDNNDPVDDREDDFPEYESPVGEINRNEREV